MQVASSRRFYLCAAAVIRLKLYLGGGVTMRVALAIVAAALVGSVPFTIAACDADDSNAPPRKGAPADSGADVSSPETSTGTDASNMDSSTDASADH